jgi:hypothetical protein
MTEDGTNRGILISYPRNRKGGEQKKISFNIQVEEIEEEDRAEVLKEHVEKYETEEESMKLRKNGWCWYKITNTILVEQIEVQW